MAEVKAGGRFLTLSKNERDMLIANSEFLQYGDVRLNKWENYGKSRLYVEVGKDKSFIDLKDDSDMELGFNNPSSGLAVIALLTKLEAEATAKATAETAEVVEVETVEVSAPTEDQVSELVGTYLSDMPHENPEIRVLQFKIAWQQIIVAPKFSALPTSQQTPHTWNDLCLKLDAEWSHLEASIQSGALTWADHLSAFKQGSALRSQDVRHE